jgi:rsbT co-antagonist protein RsbR
MSAASGLAASFDLWARASAMACLADARGRLARVNDAFADALGCEVDALVGKLIEDLVVPTEREAVARLFAASREAPLSFESRFSTKGGAPRFIVLDGVISAAADSLFLLGRDLTPMADAAERGLRAEEMFRLVVDNVPQQICWKDMRGVYQGCNQSFSRAAGLAGPDEIIGKVDSDVPWTDDAPPSRAYGRGLMGPDARGSRSIEPLTAPDGTRLWLDLVKLPLHDPRGAVDGNLTIVDDVSARLRHETELKRFFDVSPDPLCVLSLNGQFLRMNRAWESTLGYPLDDLKAMRLPDIVHERDLVPCVEQLQRLASAPTTLGLECRCRSRTGVSVWLSWALLSVPEEGLIYASVRNVDRRKRLERALMQRIEVKMLVGSISSNFVNVRFEAIDSGINNALAQLGDMLGANRASLFLFTEDGEYLENTHEWVEPGVPSLLAARGRAPRDRHRWLLEQLAGLEPLHVARVSDMPREARAERQELERQGVKALVRVPMMYGGRLIGVVGLDSTASNKVWDKDARSLLRLLSEVFAVTLERKRAEEALRENLRIIERQESAIQTLSTPIIRVWDGVLALPLVGAVDSRRAAEITHKLLHAIVETKSRHAIIELTGVEEMDPATADHVLAMLRTIEFLGAQGIVAGVRPAVAKTMAALSFDLKRMSIQRDLQHALKLCLSEAPPPRGPRD